MSDGTALIGRWYRREWPSGNITVRMPYKVTMDPFPRVTYRSMTCSSGCTALAWRRWATKAELMPEGWEPEGWDGWEPPKEDG
jgi:hypothetical protein